MRELTEDTLQDILQENENVMVMYGASWCGACKLTKPKVRRMSDANEHIEFVYVDAELMPKSRDVVVIKNLPTFASFKSGELVASMATSKADKIEEILNAIK